MHGYVTSKKITVSLHDQAVEIRLPPCLASDLDGLFPASVLRPTTACNVVTVHESEDGFTVESTGRKPAVNVGRDEVPVHIVEEVTRSLIVGLDSAIALHAAVVGHDGTSILIPGLTGSGKTSVAAWLIESGFEYVTDELAVLTPGGTILGFPRPLVIKSGAAQRAQDFAVFKQSVKRKCGSRLLALPPDAMIDSSPQEVSLILFPRYELGANVAIEWLTPAEAALRLTACNLNARNLENGGFDAVTALCRKSPAIAARYENFAHLKGTLDVIIRCAVDNRFTPAELGQFLAAMAAGEQGRWTAGAAGPLQADARTINKRATPASERRLVSNPSDSDGVEQPYAQNLIGYVLDQEWPDIRPAPLERDWMDATQHRFAYRCLPLNIANGYGWELLCPSGFTATWDGTRQSDGICVEPDAGTIAPAISHFGHGVLTFNLPYVFRTDPGVDLLAQGPINRPKDAIGALAGIIETDWCPFTFTMNWLFTRPRTPVRFEKGEPFCHIFPVRRGELDAIVPVLRPISDDPELKQRYDNWHSSRCRFNADQAQPGSPAYGGQWQKFYQYGLDSNNVPIATEGHRTRIRLRPFVKE
jgi:hypothetical protein